MGVTPPPVEVKTMISRGNKASPPPPGISSTLPPWKIFVCTMHPCHLVSGTDLHIQENTFKVRFNSLNRERLSIPVPMEVSIYGLYKPSTGKIDN